MLHQGVRSDAPRPRWCRSVPEGDHGTSRRLPGLARRRSHGPLPNPPLRPRRPGRGDEALHDLVKAGKARYLGASSMWAWQFAKLQHAAAIPLHPVRVHAGPGQPRDSGAAPSGASRAGGRAWSAAAGPTSYRRPVSSVKSICRRSASTRLNQGRAVASSKSAIQTRVPELSASIVILREVGPVISRRRSARPGAGGATRQSGSARTSAVSSGNRSLAPGRPAVYRSVRACSSDRRAPNRRTTGSSPRTAWPCCRRGPVEREPAGGRPPDRQRAGWRPGLGRCLRRPPGPHARLLLALGPRIEHVDAQRCEVGFVPRDDGEVVHLCRRRDEGIPVWVWVGNGQPGRAAGGT